MSADHTNVCRCCLAEGELKSLDEFHYRMDEKESYYAMLHECFDITLTKSPTNSGICDVCITCLRDSLEFKKRVLKSEKEFIRKLADCDEETKVFDVKSELTYDDFDSDDYTLAEALNTRTKSPVADKPIKIEDSDTKPVIRKKKSVRQRTEEKMNGEGDVDKSEAATKDRLKKQNTTSKSLKKTKTSTETINKKVKLKIVWKEQSSSDIQKHRANLLAVLKYSNATPFKSKTIMGYSCVYCEGEFPDPSNLRTHMTTDHKEDRLSLAMANNDYGSKLDVTDLTCNICGGNFENLYLFRDHLVNLHRKPFNLDVKDHLLQFKLKVGDVYDCALCTSTYETFKMLLQHMNVHYCNYVCKICETGFANKRSLNAHNTTHLEGSFKCQYCEKVFSNKTKKQYHEKLKHFGARNISNCAYCSQPFRSYYQRNQHMIKVHKAEAQYKCNICSKSYLLKSLLMYHIKKNHLLEKNAQCSECGYRFFSKKALKAHMVKHTGERKFQCGICNKSYARKYTLKEHLRIHNNDRRFKCSVCELTFVQKCSLKSHLLSNHGISMAASDITCVSV